MTQKNMHIQNLLNGWTPESLHKYDSSYNLQTAFQFGARADLSSVSQKDTDALTKVFNKIGWKLPYSAIIGHPGMGKTTFAKLIYATFLANNKNIKVFDVDYGIETKIIQTHKDGIITYDSNQGKPFKTVYKEFLASDQNKLPKNHYDHIRYQASLECVIGYIQAYNNNENALLKLDGKFGSEFDKIELLHEYNIPIIYVKMLEEEFTKALGYSNHESKLLQFQKRDKLYTQNSNFQIQRTQNNPIKTIQDIFNKLRR